MQKSVCLSCETGFTYYTENNKCNDTECSNGEYKAFNWTTNSPMFAKCHNLCEWCNGGTEFNCTKCNDERKLEDGMCLECTGGW